jgi:hypothetical protein
MPAIILFYVALLIFLVPGWIMNLISIVSGFDAMATGELLVRLVGLPVGVLGAIMGWFF